MATIVPRCLHVDVDFLSCPKQNHRPTGQSLRDKMKQSARFEEVPRLESLRKRSVQSSVGLSPTATANMPSLPCARSPIVRRC
jgi:hypothetical protein